MNINETKAINEAQEMAEKCALINEAVENSPNFLHFLLGWMQNSHLDEIHTAAEAWLNTHKE
jgi:hypothetical protein